jgi:predicted AlkP superfamily pyrophosphatase or phosphodiesterase
MKRYIVPDYNKSIVNIINSVLNYYTVENKYTTVNILDDKLGKNYKNILFMIFDGLGTDIIQKNLSAGSFLNSNNYGSYTSVFPSTTTAAMTSYYTGLSPNEHGWIGWSLFFKEYSRIVDIYLNQDSFTGQAIDDISVAYNIMPYRTIFEKIRNKNSDLGIFTLQPAHISFPSNGNINCKINSLDNLFSKASEICNYPGKNFIFSYWDNPDSVMHETGCNSKETVEYLQKIDNELSSLTTQLDDTLVIISADHGQTSITHDFYINDYQDLFDCMIMPPSVESRAVSFFIKANKKRQFERLFNTYFHDEFMLFSRNEIFDKKILGFGKTHSKTLDFIGDFVAIGIGSSLLRFKSMNSNQKRIKKFLGHHAGLTPEEMLVPLIIKEI